MNVIYYELSVLAKSVHFKNLSAAALHVGLSQPQLSRIIAKIEDQINVVLLDRSAKRKSGWTATAFHLATVFEKSIHRLETELAHMSQKQMLSEIRIGTLEGLSSFAMNVSRSCFKELKIKKIVLDIFDLSDLEAHFMAGDLDLIFTSKTPGRQKFKHIGELGYQQLEQIKTNPDYFVLSTFEFGRTARKEIDHYNHVLVSNSLAIRKEWFDSMGGTGQLPTEAKRGKPREHEPVYMIGSEILSPMLWQKIYDSIEL